MAAGIAAAEWGRFVDWALDLEMNWADVPGIVVGTSIPAAAGAIFASRLAERDTGRLARAQLAAQQEFHDELAADDRAEREVRRRRWEQIGALADEYLDVANQQDPGGHHRERAREEAAELLAGIPGEQREGKEFVDRISGLAGIHIDNRAALRRLLPSLIDALTEQIESGHVEDLRNLVLALTDTQRIVERGAFWLRDDYIELREFDGPVWSNHVADVVELGTATVNVIVSEITRCLRQLSTIAHREASYASDITFDPMVHVGFGRSSATQSVLLGWRDSYETIARLLAASSDPQPSE